MTNTKYFKQADTNKLFSVSTDENVNVIYQEFMEEEGVTLDSDSSWHFHDYNFSLLNDYTTGEVISLLEKDGGYESVLRHINKDDDINVVKVLLQQSLSYAGVARLYNLVNNDGNSDVVAYVVNGYSQGEATFVWFYNYLASGMKDTYTPDYVQSVLYDNWLAIDMVDSEGEYLEGVDNIVTRDDDDVKSYMLENYNAAAANTKTIIY